MTSSIISAFILWMSVPYGILIYKLFSRSSLGQLLLLIFPSFFMIIVGLLWDPNIYNPLVCYSIGPSGWMVTYLRYRHLSWKDWFKFQKMSDYQD